MKVAARKLFRKTMLPAYENGGIVSGMDMGGMPPPMDMGGMPPPPPMGMDMGGMPPPPPMDPASGELQAAAGMIENFKNIDQQLDMVGDNPAGIIQALTGKTVPEARNDLAGIVGLPDAQQTPDSVLALVQPTLLIAEQASMAEQGGIQTLGMGEPPPMGMGEPPPMGMGEPPPFPPAALGDPSNPIAAPTIEVPAARFGGYVRGFANAGLVTGGIDDALQKNPYSLRNQLVTPFVDALQQGFVPGQRGLDDQLYLTPEGNKAMNQAVISSFTNNPVSVNVGPAFSNQVFTAEELEEQQRQQEIVDKARIDRGEAPPQGSQNPLQSFQNVEEAKQYYRQLTGTDAKIAAETARQQEMLGYNKSFEDLYEERVGVFTDEGLLTPPVTEAEATERVNKVYGDINKDAAGEFWLALAAAGGRIASSRGTSLLEAIGSTSPELAGNLMQIGREQKTLMRERGLKIEDLVRESEKLRRAEKSAILSGAINDAQALELERKRLSVSIATQYAPNLKVKQGIHYRDPDNSFGYKKPAVRANFLVDENNPETVFLQDPDMGLVPINTGYILGNQDNIKVTDLAGGTVKTVITMQDGTIKTFYDSPETRTIRSTDEDPKAQALASERPGSTTFYNLQNPENKRDVLLSDTIKNEKELFLTDPTFRRDYLRDQQKLEKSLTAFDKFLNFITDENTPVGVKNVLQRIINKGTTFSSDESFLKQFEDIEGGELFKQAYDLAFKQAEIQYTSSDRIANKELEVVREYLKEDSFFSNPVAAIMKAQTIRMDVYNGLQKTRAVTSRIENPEEGGFSIPNITLQNDILPLGISKTTAFDVTNPSDATYIQAVVSTYGASGKIPATGEQGIATKLEDKFIFVPEKMIPGLVEKNNNLKEYFGDEKTRRGRLERKRHGDKKGKGFYFQFSQITPDRVDTSQISTILGNQGNPQF